MALDINTGYSSAFKTFVEFAQKTQAAGHSSATAKATLSSRTITVSALSLDGTSLMLRSSDETKSNNATRALFKAAIRDMFGGESRIPQAVKDAMELGDYGKGRPLSARRILAVKAAIDRNNAIPISRASAQAGGAAAFESPEVEEAALALGFTRAELPKLARATELYMQYSGEMEFPPKTEMEAMREVAKSGSKAGRLASYGGRFLESAENFKDGMALLDSFANWFADVREFCEGNARNRADADTSTKRDLSYELAVDDTTVKGLERMIFQDLAADPEANLKETDPETLFGMDDNAAMRFFGRNCHEAMLGTVFNVPPEKRRTLFAAFDAFMPAGMNLKIDNNRLFAARVLNHIDELADLQAKGQLTMKNIIKTCFPDIKKTGGYNLSTLNRWFESIDGELDAAGVRKNADRNAVKETMIETGCTVKEAIDSLRNGVKLSHGAYQIGYSMGLHEFPGGGFDLMASDMKRSYSYSAIDGNGKIDENNPLLPGALCRHKLNFPDGSIIHCGSKPELKDNVDIAIDKVKKLCGAGHDLQANIVASCLSQSANGPLRGALQSYGIYASEHAALNYTLSKDKSTGAINIRYSSPESLPVQFAWTCTVNVDGTCTATPLAVTADMRPVGDITAEMARKMVSESMERLGIDEKTLRPGMREAAESSLMRHGSGLSGVGAKLFSNYVVNIAAYGGANDDEIKSQAEDMKKWRFFGLGDERLAQVGEKFAKRQNAYMHGMLANPGNSFDKNHPDLFGTFCVDANRNDWNINGTQLNRVDTEGEDVIQAFLSAVPNKMHRKAISILFNQGNFADIQAMMGKTAIPEDAFLGKGDLVKLHDIPGSELFVSRDESSDAGPIIKDRNNILTLNFSEDGNTAYLTTTLEKDIMAKAFDTEHPRQIGTLVFSQMTTIDLTQEIPEVTNVTFSQSFGER